MALLGPSRVDQRRAVPVGRCKSAINPPEEAVRPNTRTGLSRGCRRPPTLLQAALPKEVLTLDLRAVGVVLVAALFGTRLAHLTGGRRAWLAGSLVFAAGVGVYVYVIEVMLPSAIERAGCPGATRR